MEQCIFCRIANGEIPAKKILENDRFFAFYDINPVAPVHALVIPKAHVSSIAGIPEGEEDVVAGMFPFIRDVAKALGLHEDGYRVVLNTGEKAGQTVHHMHAHILGGEEMGWPPK